MDKRKFIYGVRLVRDGDIEGHLMALLIAKGYKPTLAHRLGRGELGLVPKAA